jgi:hypothetical protein
MHPASQLIVGMLNQAQRFRVELEHLTLLVDRCHPLKQLGVEIDCVLVSCQFRRLGCSHLLQLWIRIRGSHGEERSLHPLQ